MTIRHTRGNGNRRYASIIFLLVCCVLGGCAAPTSPLSHDAYIWQFRWNDGLSEAVGASVDVVDTWHVLGGVVGPAGHVRSITPDFSTLAKEGRRATIVFRIDARLESVDQVAVLSQLKGVVDRWPADLVAGIEIDYDSATSKLRLYGRFIGVLGRMLPGRPIGITMLPTWMSSPDFPALAATVDNLVLQVHAIQKPDSGLFDAAAARRWIDALAGRCDTPFRVALPTYGARVDWDREGSVISVESESDVAGSGLPSEVHADPYEMAQFVRSLQARHPATMRGIVWFRLPVSGDRRAWNASTWRGVMSGDIPLSAVETRFDPVNGRPGLVDVVLVNEGDFEAAPPRRVALPTGCHTAGGANGYRAQGRGGNLILLGTPSRLLAPGAERTAGWARCSLI